MVTFKSFSSLTVFYCAVVLVPGHSRVNLLTKMHQPELTQEAFSLLLSQLIKLYLQNSFTAVRCNTKLLTDNKNQRTDTELLQQGPGGTLAGFGARLDSKIYIFVYISIILEYFSWNSQCCPLWVEWWYCS